MAIGYNYGNLAGTTNSKFRVYIRLRWDDTVTTAQSRLQRRYGCQVTKGGFGGATMHASWRDSTFKVYGPDGGDGEGHYGYSDWLSSSPQNAGYKWSYSANCYYTGGSGTRYKSSVTATATAPTKITTPNTPSSITGSINEDNDFKINWTVSTSSTKPITKQQVIRSINGVNQNTVSISNGTTRTYTWSSVANNSRYLASVRVGNSEGWSAWKTLASSLYTKPAAPTNLVAMKNGNQVTASVSTSNIRYLQECAWQYRDNTVEPAAWIDLQETSSRLNATIEAEDITVRVQAINQGNKASDWVEGVPGIVGNEKIYIKMPDEAFVDGKLKDGVQVMIRVPDGAVLSSLNRMYDSKMTVDGDVLKAEDGNVYSVSNETLNIGESQ